MNPLKTLDQSLVRPLLKPLLGAQMQGQVARGPSGRGVGVISAKQPVKIQWVNIGGRWYFRRAWDSTWHVYTVPHTPPAPRMFRPLHGLPGGEEYKTLGEVPVHLRGLVTVAGAETPAMAQAMMGATRASFAVPSGMDNTTASTALVMAVSNLLAAYAANGTPSEHAADSYALAVQQAWNADPIVQAAGSSAQLDTDSGYGPNTHDAVAAVAGAGVTVPAVNTGGGGGGGGGGTPVQAMPVWGQWLIGAAVVGGAVVIGGALAKQHGPTVMRHARATHARLRSHARRLARRPA